MGRLHTWIPAVGALALLTPQAWGAPLHEAQPQPVRFVQEREAFDAWSFDTGWLPPNNPKGSTSQHPIQVRFLGHLGGGVEASMEGQVHLGWQPWQLWASGAPEGGVLTMNLGVELSVLMRIDVVLPNGSRFTWEGPMPGNSGFDYRFAASQTFPPFLLTGAEVEQALVSDTIQKTRLLEIPITPAIIPLPEVAGSLDIDAGGVLDVILKSGRLSFPEGELTAPSPALPVTPHGAPTHPTQVRYAATALYAALLELVPQVNLNIGPLQYTLASFPVALPLDPLEETWEFDAAQPQPLTFPLPGKTLTLDGSALPATLAFDAAATRTLRIHNGGAAPLTGVLSITGEGFSLGGDEQVQLPPGESTERTVSAVVDGTPRTGALTFTSNAPSGDDSVALTTAALPPEGETPSTPDAGTPLVDTFGEGPLPYGCAAAPGPLAVWGLLLLWAARSRRRG